MTENMEDAWSRAIGNFRDVTRWIVAGIAGAVSLILGTSPLTNLGTLTVAEPRLWVALAGGIVGLMTFAFPFRAAVRVLGSRFIDIQEIASDRHQSRLCNIVDARIRHRLPPRFPTLKALTDANARLTEQIQEPGQIGEEGEILDPAKSALFIELKPYIDNATNIARFEQVKLLFDDLCWYLAVFLPIVAVSLGVFAWAANPPKKDSSTNAERSKCVDRVDATAANTIKIFVALPPRSIKLQELIESALGNAATPLKSDQGSGLWRGL